MLDLNLPSSCESAAGIWENPALPGPEDDSSTSDSSVLNAGSLIDVPDEDSCSTRPLVGFNFVILKCDDGAQQVIEDAGRTLPQQPTFVTWQLFPPASVVPDTPQLSMAASCSSSSRPQLVDLSFSQADAPSSELEVANQHRAEARQIAKKNRRGPQSRSSQYRGVTFYRRTGRWESHIWDCGKQLYLGGFDTAEAAARVYDQAALKFRGVNADINFNLSDYKENLKQFQMNTFSKEEFVKVLRRQNTGSKYRGVTRKTSFGSEVHLGQLLGKKAYHMAPKKYNGGDAFIDLEPSNCGVELLCDSSTEDHHVDLNLRISQPFGTNKAKDKEREETWGQCAYSSSLELAMSSSVLSLHQNSHPK